MPPKKRKRAEASPAQVGIAVEAPGAQRQFARVLGGKRHMWHSFFSRVLAGRVNVTTPYGSLLVVSDDLGCTYVNPFALLYHMCEVSAPLARCLHTSLQEGPMQLCLYVDAFTPGNQLRPDKGRSTEAVYWTILNLPYHFRVRRSGWFLF